MEKRKKKRGREQEVEKLWSKRQHELSVAVASQSELLGKYKEWSSVQNLDLLDRPLPPASFEELNFVMCDEIVRISKLPEANHKKP